MAKTCSMLEEFPSRARNAFAFLSCLSKVQARLSLLAFSDALKLRAKFETAHRENNVIQKKKLLQIGHQIITEEIE